ncbi:MAG TPA: beta-galactosidase, partial [Thermoanaerobaculia bacterium]
MKYTNGLLLSFLLFAAAAQAADIRGIYVYSSDVSHISKNYAAGVTSSLSVSGVDGIVLVIGWDAIEPAMGQYDFSALDTWMREAAQSGKKVDLTITAGSATPSWLFQNAGAKALNFTISPHSGATGVCDAEMIAPPWDAVFLSQWDSMLAAVSAHLKSTNEYDSVALLRLTGINRTTDELRLPAETP